MIQKTSEQREGKHDKEFYIKLVEELHSVDLFEEQFDRPHYWLMQRSIIIITI